MTGAYYLFSFLYFSQLPLPFSQRLFFCFVLTILYRDATQHSSVNSHEYVHLHEYEQNVYWLIEQKQEDDCVRV